MENLQIYRRNLPHWRLDGAVYFVTWRLYPGRDVLCEDERTKIVETLRHFENARYQLFAYVVMDDHVHVVLQPAQEYALEQIVHSWKSFSARRLQRELVAAAMRVPTVDKWTMRLCRRTPLGGGAGRVFLPASNLRGCDSLLPFPGIWF